jgi:hypothetical protein
VSDAAVLAASLNLDVAGLLREIENILRQTDPQAADEMRAGLEEVPMDPSGQEKINLRKELFENLRAPVHASMSFAKPYAPDSARLLVSVGHRDRSAIDRVLSMLPLPFVPRELRGSQVYDFQMVGISIAAGTQALHAGSTVAVEAALQAAAGQDTLASSAGFQRAAKLAPAESWLTLYVDFRRLFEGVIECTAGQDEFDPMAMANPARAAVYMLSQQLKAGQEKVEPEKLRKVLRYYAPGILTISTTPEGIHLIQVQLKPDAP